MCNALVVVEEDNSTEVGLHKMALQEADEVAAVGKISEARGLGLTDVGTSSALLFSRF